MIDQPISYKLTRTAVFALTELIQSIAIERMLADPALYPTLRDAIESVLGDAGHADMAAMWRGAQ